MSSNPPVKRPVIVAHNKKIGVLERRQTHLQRKLEKNVNYYAESDAANFDRDEIEALSDAIAALEHHRDSN